MNPATPTQEQRERQSFAETALRLGGKSEEEATRMGAVDKADEQVEALFAPQYQTASSPVHRAVWDGKVPLDLFAPPPCRRRRRATRRWSSRWRSSAAAASRSTLLDDDSKVSDETIAELAEAGYWGLLIDPKYGGQGAPFARFARFLTRMATLDPMVAGLASVHGCIGAVDPVRTFGTPEQKAALPAAAGQRRDASPASP